MPLVRHSEIVPDIAIDTVLADATPFSVRDMAGGYIDMPTTSTLTSITWYAATSKGGTYRAAIDENGDAIVSTVVQNQAPALPSALYNYHWLKGVGNVAETVNIALKG